MNRTILLGHGSGGLMSSDLISRVFVSQFDNPLLGVLSDASLFRVNQPYLAFTTDSFVVDPLFFPGGDIGKLAVCGTVNDLSVSGARPRYLSSGFILEEGFPIETLERIVASMAAEAQKAGVQIITGDTKVVRRGQCDKIFINTAGIGEVEERHTAIAGGSLIRTGDRILVSGYLGDHEMAVLSARENLSFDPPVESDVAPLNAMIHAVLDAGAEVRFMRDITRGGLATILAEIVSAGQFGVEFEEVLLPVREQVAGLCELYGFNPLYLANEGKVLMVVSPGSADRALEVMQQFDTGRDARIIGSVTDRRPGKVLMKSVTGGTRVVDKLAGEQLPRIC